MNTSACYYDLNTIESLERKEMKKLNWCDKCLKTNDQVDLTKIEDAYYLCTDCHKIEVQS